MLAKVLTILSYGIGSQRLLLGVYALQVLQMHSLFLEVFIHYLFLIQGLSVKQPYTLDVILQPNVSCSLQQFLSIK